MRKIGLVLVALVLVAAGAFGGYRYAHRSMTSTPCQPGGSTPAQVGGVVQDASGKQVLYWFDPMYPQQKFDKPGKSPFMDMQLVPKCAGDNSEAGSVSISAQMVQNLGVRTTQAKSGSLEQRYEAVGSVAYNERGVVRLQARANGFVQKLHARAPLDPVKKGAPLVEILYPDWAGAQEECVHVRLTTARTHTRVLPRLRRVSGSMIFSCSLIEPGHPCVTMTGQSIDMSSLRWCSPSRRAGATAACAIPRADRPAPGHESRPGTALVPRGSIGRWCARYL